jgi:hypothetical protein
MSGGKGGSTTSKVEIPAWLEGAAKSNLARADEIAKLGFRPYFGPDVAALTPMQQAAMRNTNSAASAFGMAAPSDPMAGMPAAQDFGGVQGYSSAPLYQGSVDALQASMPALYDAIRSMFIDQQTGAQPRSPFGGPLVQPQAAASVNPLATMWSNRGGGSDNDSGYAPSYAGSGSSTTSLNTPLSYAPGGVNTRNPDSVVNRVAAAVSGPQSAPTAANRPVANPRR